MKKTLLAKYPNAMYNPKGIDASDAMKRLPAAKEALRTAKAYKTNWEETVSMLQEIINAKPAIPRKKRVTRKK